MAINKSNSSKAMDAKKTSMTEADKNLGIEDVKNNKNRIIGSSKCKIPPKMH